MNIGKMYIRFIWNFLAGETTGRREELMFMVDGSKKEIFFNGHGCSRLHRYDVLDCLIEILGNVIIINRRIAYLFIEK